MKTPNFLQIPASPTASPFSICNGKSPDDLRVLPDNSIDAIITDPPYGLGYNHNEWDATVPDPQVWLECYRIGKPGAYLVAFCAKRTSHHLAKAIEDAGFEIKDKTIWFHGQGASKTEPLDERLKDAGANEKVLELFGNYRGDIRPLYEDIIIAQKPIQAPNLAINLIKYGTGVLNSADVLGNGCYAGDILCEYEQIIQDQLSGKGSGIGVLSFPRASQKERADACKGLFFDGATNKRPKKNGHANEEITNEFNFHPTVKPIALMKFLVELFSIPGAVILDPFMGSSSTGVGALLANRRFIGVEMDSNYFKLAKHRLEKTALEIPHNPVETAINVHQLLKDNDGLNFMREIQPKIKDGSASLDDFRKYRELLKKFGPLPSVA